MPERQFDYKPGFDERNLQYTAAHLLGADPVRRDRSRYWWEGPVLDQGREGACVGFGWTTELMASPSRVKLPVAEAYALGLYREAQRNDEWPGEAYEGTSVLAGAKVVANRGYITEYRWAYSVDEIIDSVIALGPVVIGIPWYDSMYETRPGGLVEAPSGAMVGGHCLTITGYHPKLRIWKEGWLKRFEILRWRNSWGLAYGNRGDGYIRPEDLETLFKTYGEACVPISRVLHPKV